jgi:hypothetical protein
MEMIIKYIVNKQVVILGSELVWFWIEASHGLLKRISENSQSLNTWTFVD